MAASPSVNTFRISCRTPATEPRKAVTASTKAALPWVISAFPRRSCTSSVMNSASVEMSRASNVAKILRSWSETSIRLMSTSPHLHAAVDDDVDARYVRALVRDEEQRDVGDLLRLAEATEERLAEHVVSPLGVVELFSRLIGFDDAGRDGVGPDPVLAALHGELACHADDSRLRGCVGERR